MSSLTSIVSGDLRNLLGNMCYTKGTLAINAGGAATIKTTGAVTYTVDGQFYLKTLTAQAITITHDAFGAPVATGYAKYIQPVGTVVYYVVSVNAAGTVAISQGTYAGQPLPAPNDKSKVWTGTGAIPMEPAGYTPIGAFKVSPTVAATFDPGTTLLDAANVAVVYADTAILPASF